MPPALRLRLRITAAAESRLRARHPWLFSDSVREQNRPGELGELAVIYDRRDRFLAVGLFDPESPIRVRILHAGRPQALDEIWWEQRLRQAVDRREGLCDAQTSACRLIHGESDGWPGLVLDRYADTLVLKIYTGAWLPRMAQVTDLMSRGLQPRRLVLRLSRNIQEIARDRFQLWDGQELRPTRSNPPPPAHPPALSVPSDSPSPEFAEFLESGLRFEADVVRGQKTGFFLDQRENRRRVERLSAGRHLLNGFSFSGGFSVYAARGGARSVTDLDLSAHALAGARRNFELNQSIPAVRACGHETIQGDAFAWLDQAEGRKFDLVVLDPPSLAKREAERAGALEAYAHLAGRGVRALRPGGILVAASCSAHVPAGEFFSAVLKAARRSGKSFHELDRTGHPPDHPVGFPEAEYLKCIYLSFVPR